MFLIHLLLMQSINDNIYIYIFIIFPDTVDVKQETIQYFWKNDC